MTICDRCGDVTVGDEPCRCRVPYDPVDVRRRHRAAVQRARVSDAWLRSARPPDTTRAA